METKDDETGIARKFADTVENGKVSLMVLGDDEASSFEIEFDSREEIELFASENTDLPEDVKQSMFANQQGFDQAAQPGPKVTSIEAMYLIEARHAELANKIVAGERPSEEYFKDMAEKDAADYSRLDDAQKNKVNDDIELAAIMSPAYSAGTILLKGKSETVAVEAPAKATVGLNDAELEEIRRKMASANTTETEQARSSKAGVESYASVIRTGAELPKAVFIIPPSISKDYLENNGEYFSKKDNRLMFRESKEGNSLRTTFTDKKAIADMMEIAKAKQWSNIALIGSKEFRRAAWLEAESNGIKTKGYTPTKEDTALMVALMKERPANTISNVDSIEKAAPRSPAIQSQASLGTDAKLNLTKHLLELGENPAFKGRNQAELLKIAEVRALLDEDMKSVGKKDIERSEFLTKFDKTMEEPKNLAQIEKAAEVEHEQALPPRNKQRSQSQEAEQSL